MERPNGRAKSQSQVSNPKQNNCTKYFRGKRSFDLLVRHSFFEKRDTSKSSAKIAVLLFRDTFKKGEKSEQAFIDPIIPIL